MSETMMSQANENTENVDQKALELAQDFSYDGYQVVRRELFAHLREPAVVIRRDSVTFNTACIAGLEDAVYIQILVNQGLLVTEHNGLAAQLVILTEGNGLHSGGSGLVQHCLCVLREVGALINRNRALGHLHAECHTGGAAALLTVLLRRQLKNVQTFQSHDMYPPSA